MVNSQLLLAIDTCGPTGSVALGRYAGGSVEILGQIELEGRSYSATLVAAVGDLLVRSGVKLENLAAIVTVNGPGSFTGVRVGISAVKGLAEAAYIPPKPPRRRPLSMRIATKSSCASASKVSPGRVSTQENCWPAQRSLRPSYWPASQ